MQECWSQWTKHQHKSIKLLQNAVGFGFEVYNYAGGFDEEATVLFGEVHECVVEFQASLEGRDDQI